MRLAFIGTSNLALTTAEMLLEAGHEVVFIEKDRDFMNPEAVLQLVDQPSVSALASQVRKRLERVRDAVASS